jgi:hypothetical protein
MYLSGHNPLFDKPKLLSAPHNDFRTSEMTDVFPIRRLAAIFRALRVVHVIARVVYRLDSPTSTDRYLSRYCLCLLACLLALLP